MTVHLAPRDAAGRRVTLRLGRASGVLRPRAVVVCLALGLLTFAAFCLAIATGDYPVTLSLVLRELFGVTDYDTWIVINEIRLPRALTAVGVGATFGLSGAIFQTITRNPLAAPDIIGITEGATVFVVGGVVFGVGAGLGMQGLALVGALGTAAVIYLLARQRGSTGYRIILIGIGVSAVCLAVTDYLLSRSEIWEAQALMGWLVGNLNLRGWEHARPVLIALAVLGPAALVAHRWMALLQLGDDVATGLGVPANRARFTLLLVGVGLAAVGTAAAGPILFVALVSPQIAQRLVRRATPPLVASALTGAATVLLADVIAQRLLDGVNLPVGVITGVLGAPCLIWLLVRANRTGSGG
ncbi:iron ABC transporter permease [Pilimelia anulata]|uniref:Iron ABC transporter permease n=1 Tax=Pilimelia anulata TaxID=53371 RepID=A0A8J3AZS5_9ACTN|nr:iron chelate uptake ABC transporter family permease subunit [Pilimelia anulata]GGJ80400.1 iron ABC transporter permease [Pilimelia anulata]